MKHKTKYSFPKPINGVIYLQANTTYKALNTLHVNKIVLKRERLPRKMKKKLKKLCVIPDFYIDN